LAWKKQLFSAYLIIAALPVYIIRFQIGPLPSTPLEAMILILFFVLLIRRKIDWKKFYRQPFFWPLLVILIISLVSAVISPNRLGALGIWRAYFLESEIFFICLLSLIKTRKELYGIFWALGASALYLTVFSFWQKFSGWAVPQAFLNPDGTADRVVSVFGYPNALGLYLGPIIILFTGWLGFGERKFWPLIFKIAVIVFSFVTIVLAQSEAAILAVLAVWFLFLLYFKKTRILALILLVISVIILVAEPSLRSFATEKLLLHDWSGIVRRQIWAETINLLRDHWLLGAGLAGYQTAIVPYHTSANWMEIYLYPHNIIMNFWSELGLLGLLAFIWLGVKYFWVNVAETLRATSWRVKLMSVTLMAVTLEIIIHGLVDVPFFKNDLSVLFMIILAVAVINWSLQEKKE
jgi:O-antigen ligase